MFAFLRQVVTNYHTTGAVFPSSRRLAMAMTRLIRATPGSRRVLEVGPGTGAFTTTILGALRSGDRYELVEINPEFAKRLERKVLAPFRALHPDIEVRLQVGPIEDTLLEGEFDFIICGLPFNLFPLSVVREMFRTMLAHLRPGGMLTYFEYVGMRVLRVPLSGPRGWRRLRRRAAHVKALDRRHHGERDLIVRNLPPAVAIHLKG